MPQSRSAVYIQLVFSTRDRRPFFDDRELRLRLHKYIGGTSELSRVREYVARQEGRHRGVSFQEEFLSLLREHDLTWDERYLWD